MGVPALFRWLSKKYPKVVSRVVEDTPTKVRQDGGDIVEIPVQYESENPNGFEIDNLYLDMNGIVHPCTHPEGRPAPETEAEMMIEVFRYTERVVNMARPRKVLIMAIDGVAPRAKMNQQRSRRFRAAQEAAEKEDAHQESIRLFEAMGQTVSDETKNKKAWDSNAITPGTPFMDLLSASLKYWVANKLTNDPGWKDLKVIISDASVPGEGEHKIVDWIRRQRACPDWDPNTSHAIYGLDADLIMLALATHEPHFRVLREDVFFQGQKGPNVCSNCGKPGHIKANCLGQKAEPDPNVVEKAKPVDPKPFIWLDVSCLREYLAVELNVPGVPFFDAELAIDDWVMLIFFVGNDFLPHLPSLEIREGAIDVLLKIWRAELGRMGGYLTNNGKVNLDRAQIILEGVASREDEIFQKRKDDEDRQNANQKRRRIDEHRRQEREGAFASGESTPAAPTPGSMQMNGQDYVAVTPTNTSRGDKLHPSLPTRPGFDIATQDGAQAAPKPGKKLTYAQQAQSLKAGLAAMEGSNADVVKNRKAIRMANMSAAQALKAELEGGEGQPTEGDEAMDGTEDAEQDDADDKMNGSDSETQDVDDGDDEEEGDDEETPKGKKRKADDDDDDDDVQESNSDVAPASRPENEAVPKKKLKVNPDGTVDYEDTVRLWEPGYRDRYYRSKFGIEVSDTEYIRGITRSYLEGLCWVLEYYYQGVPAWDWYYPYHYAPFAQDFKNSGKEKIDFKSSKPFTPYAQLLGVFPAASRIHLPEPLQQLMIQEDSPIIDFYPSDFEIDMNGKKMAWQGVALLPFIDQHRLLAALKSKEPELSDDEKRRNTWGNMIMFIAEANKLFDSFCKLYGVKSDGKVAPMDTKMSLGVSGSIRRDPKCVPNSTMETPIPSIDECPDLETNTSLSVEYFFPPRVNHRSVLLRGYKPQSAMLTESDKDWVRRGGHNEGGRGGRGGRRGGRRSDGHDGGRHGGHGGHNSAPRSNAYSGAPEHYSAPPRNPYGGAAGGAAYPPPRNPYGGGAGGYGGGGGRNPYGAPAPTAAYPSYGGYNGGGGGGYGGGGGNYGAARGGYNAPPANSYGAPPASYGRGPPGGAPAAYGGGGGRGGRGGHNPYAQGGGRGAPPRRY